MSSSSKSSSTGGLQARIPTEDSINPLIIRTSQPTPTASSASATKPHPIDDRRLYIGNLDPTIDEYMLLKLFSPFGKVTKLDFMFHYSGPKKGTPRGYCFLDYETSSQAAAAIKQMNRRSLKNRPLIVSLANIAPPSTDHHHPDGRKRTQDPNRPTAFSILKAGALKNASTDEKIKAMERKLAQMTESSSTSSNSKQQQQPSHPSLPSRPAESASGAGSSSSLSSSSSRTTTSASSTSSHRGAGAGSNSSARQRPY